MYNNDDILKCAYDYEYNADDKLKYKFEYKYNTDGYPFEEYKYDSIRYLTKKYQIPTCSKRHKQVKKNSNQIGIT